MVRAHVVGPAHCHDHERLAATLGTGARGGVEQLRRLSSVQWVYGGIRERWDLWGLENGPLGYPVSGEQDSGPWARPGLFFVMVDRETRRVAAATPVPPLICPPA